MPLVILVLLTLVGTCFAQGTPQKVTSKISPTDLQALVSTGNGCSDLQTSILCRAWPWQLRKDEGFFSQRDVAVLVLRDQAPADFAENQLLNALGSQRRLESYLLLLLSDTNFLGAFQKSTYISLIVLLHGPDSNKIVAAFNTSQGGVSQFAGQFAPLWRKEIAESLTWFIPEDFVPFYQFETF